MAKFVIICALATFFSVLDVGRAQQNGTVTYCPLYLVLQNRCPTPSTTAGTSTTPRPTNSSETDDECGTLTFCPAMEAFLTGGRNCSEGQTVQIGLTTLGDLLVNPSGENAAATVGQAYVDALGDAFASISKTIQAQTTQATIGVTFVPIGQIIG